MLRWILPRVYFRGTVRICALGPPWNVLTRLRQAAELRTAGGSSLPLLTAQRQISPERKAVFYIGMVVGVIGFISFISTFFSAASSFGDFTNFAEKGRSMATRAVVGIVMIIAGGILAGIGRMGLAGSGLKLDPEETRRDVEPWARMTGGVIKDALDEAGLKLGKQSQDEELPLDERLRRLQKLREENLINEQEYESGRKKILESA